VFIRFVRVATLAISGMAQDSRAIGVVTGTLITDEALTGSHLIVNLVESIQHRQVARAYVGSDGSFEFRDVPIGVYMVELAATNGEPFYTQAVNIRASGDQIEIRLPSRENKLGAGGTVSVRELHHPLSAKSKKIIAAAQKASAAAEYAKAIEILRGALNDPAAVPYVRMNIGVAYLRLGQPAAAIPELQEAERLMPDDAVVHTNFAFALLLVRRDDAAEVECRRALQLDRNSAKARWVMGSILLKKGSHEEEAVEDLRFASREIPKAKVILAQFYERTGQKDAAARELREFLPQASGEDRVTVERWLSKLTSK
jgi:tetratricopeptide (TPR) repeat protein